MARSPTYSISHVKWLVLCQIVVYEVLSIRIQLVSCRFPQLVFFDFAYLLRHYVISAVAFANFLTKHSARIVTVTGKKPFSDIESGSTAVFGVHREQSMFFDDP
jgi:hypothetical protein